MGWYLNRTGRPILYSCSWPAYIGNVSIQRELKTAAESGNSSESELFA